MRRVSIVLLIVFSLISVFLMMPEAYSQKAYDISHYYAIYRVRNDGSLLVTESITFNFMVGSFSWAERTIPHQGFDELDRFNVTLTNGSPLQFQQSYNWPGKYYFRWYYGPVDSPIELTFVLAYRLTNALTQPSKLQSGFDWSVVGLEWSVPIRDLQADVHLPFAYDDPSLFNWSPEQDGYAYFVGNHSVVQFNYPYLPPRTPYRAIVYFPKILDVSVSPQRFLRESPFTIGFIVFSVLSLAYVPLWWAKGREPRVSFPPTASVGLSQPSDRTPSEVGYIMTQRYGVQEMISTILDLAKRGFVQIIHESRDGGKVWFGRRRDEIKFQILEKGKDPSELAKLKPHELLTLQMLEDALTARHIPTAHPRSSDISTQLAKSLTDEGLFPANPRWTRTKYIIVGVGLFASALVVALLLGVASPQTASIYVSILLGIGFSGIPLVVVGYYMPKLTRSGAEEKVRWKRFLENVRNNVEGLAKSSPDQAVQLFDSLVPWFFLIPSLRRLGKQQAWFKSLEADLRHVTYSPAWYVYHGPVGSGQGTTFSAIGDFGSFISNFSTAFSTMSTSAATATGGGAGAGGGGGGGGGGAG